MSKTKKLEEKAANSRAKPYFSENSRMPICPSESSNSIIPRRDTPVNPMSTKNVLHVCMKHHKLSLDAMKKKNLDIMVRAQKTNMAAAEKTQEIEKLKRLIQKLERKDKELNELNRAHVKKIELLEQKYVSINSKYVSLETGYDLQITNWNMTKEKQAAQIAAQHKHCKDLTNEFDAAKQENQYLRDQFEAMYLAKDHQIAELEIDCTQLQAHIVQIEAGFEQEKQQLEQKWMSELQHTKEAQLGLQAELEQKSVVFAKDMERISQVEAESALWLQKLKDCEKQCTDLQQMNKELSEKILNITNTFESKLEEQKLKIDELSSNNEGLAVANKTEQLNYQKEMIALKEANEQFITMKSVKETEAEQELSLRQIQISELKLQIEELKKQNLNAKNLLSAENLRLTQELQALQEIHKTNLASVQDELVQRESDIAACREHFAELEREKNTTIAELKYKLNKIGHAFEQPVGTVSAMKSPQIKTQTTATMNLTDEPQPTTSLNASALNETSNEISDITTGAGKRRISNKRPVYSLYNSDFSTDTSDYDEEPNWEPETKLTYLIKSQTGHKVKRVKRLSVQETSNLFDKLK